MATVVWNATLDDLYRAEGKAQLADGEVLLMHAAGDRHGIAARNIAESLPEYARATGVGGAYGDNVGFLCELPNRRSFSPDCAYYTGPRAGMKFLPQAQVIAVEIRSEEDDSPAAEQRLARKRADYFAAGARRPMPNPPYPAGNFPWTSCSPEVT